MAGYNRSLIQTESSKAKVFLNKHSHLTKIKKKGKQ